MALPQYRYAESQTEPATGSWWLERDKETWDRLFRLAAERMKREGKLIWTRSSPNEP